MEDENGLTHGAYQWIAKVNGLRKRMPRIDFAVAKQKERYVDDDLYVFQRGKIMVALTNGGTGFKRLAQTISDSPWATGTKVCNIFDPLKDCTEVGANRTFEVVLRNGESKLYAPQEFATASAPDAEEVQGATGRWFSKHWYWLAAALLAAIAAAWALHFVMSKKKARPVKATAAAGGEDSEQGTESDE